MEKPFFFFFFYVFVFHCLTLFAVLPPPAACSCSPSDRQLIDLAFRHVTGFHLPPPEAGDCSLILPFRNLSGTVSWTYLRNVSTLRVLDLSCNALQGSVPGILLFSSALLHVNLAANRLGGALRFHSLKSPSPLVSLNLTGNRFTSAAGLEALPRLEVLDLSRNSLALVPRGLEKLRRLRHLDVSINSMRGVFPDGLPPFSAGFDYLNISYNNFIGVVKSDVLKKFGKSAFVKAGSLKFLSSARVARSSSPTSLPSQKKQHEQKRRKRVRTLGVIAGVASVLVVLAASACILYVIIKKKSKGRKDDEKWEEKEETATTSPQEVRWVVEAKLSAPVVLFEKPLMELSFADLAKATSGFGKESQLTEGGRSGPAYRAVLPSDMHVVVRVVEAARDTDERAVAASFRELARLRHPNLLPLLGYCIPGKDKLALYEYMERGDLHRWLHELPAGQPDVEDWSGDTWDGGEERRDTAAPSAAAVVGDWPTRHRIALGIARGLAFLHQGWVGSTRGVAHGHLVPSNILLGDDLEPRVADFGAAAGTAESDVYDFGVVVMELVTGREGWSEEAVCWARGLVRSGRVTEAVDPRLRVAGPEEEREVVECFRVGYLCTAPAPEKRPTMQQVVGLLKDLRPCSSTAGGGANFTT
ncbi:putative LRR receptor-like serine/threonine-protein kinase [Canna indica]|uniref:LRR receptor-like serine/threonine-protein kinase n=1 Tax=Canna indica TaxID=4628 RepID=A0AAQ3KGX7_9LILI|nr:putative LRR receptor-like serine/threonine-protein kinase [Canna indica]